MSHDGGGAGGNGRVFGRRTPPEGEPTIDIATFICSYLFGFYELVGNTAVACAVYVVEAIRYTDSTVRSASVESTSNFHPAQSCRKYDGRAYIMLYYQNCPIMGYAVPVRQAG